MLELFRSYWKRLIKKRADTTVIIPALNESSTIAKVISLAQSSKRVGEVIVVDDGSIDDTASIASSCGARVIYSMLLGKGASMTDGLKEATFPFVVFLDADLARIAEDTVDRLVKPLEKGDADLVKGRFSRSKGRVTELVAKPLLRLFFPELSALQQPLSGQMAIKRDLGRSIGLESDYGADIGLLIDVAMRDLKIVEVNLGDLEHRHHTLQDLSGMAFQVAQTILQRAQFYGRIDGENLRVMSSVERQMEAAIEGFSRLGPSARTVLLNLDGVLWEGHFISAAAEHFGFSKTATMLMENADLSGTEKIESIARLFSGVPREDLAVVASNMPLSDGAVQAVVDLRRLGYTVGIFTEGFLLAAEVARRRVFADFCIGHMLEYSRGQCTGKVQIAEAYKYPAGCHEHNPCKSNILWHLKDQGIAPQNVVVVGNSSADACLLAHAGLGIAYRPVDEQCQAAANVTLTTPKLSKVVEYLTSMNVEKAFSASTTPKT